VKVTKQEFNQFKRACLKYQKMLNLMDWTLYIGQEEMDDRRASCYTLAANRTAKIVIATEWEPQDRDLGIESLAAHEITHLWLATLSYLGECRYVTESEMDLENERLAVTLSNVLPKVRK